MGDTIDLELAVGEDIIRAWVLDDILKEGNQVAASVIAAGIEAQCVKLSDLSERIDSVIACEEAPPDVALIDLQWSTGHSNVQLGKTNIAVEDRSRFGLKIAEHLRGLEEFRRCTIVIATQYPDRDIAVDLEELGMAVLIPKRLIRELPTMVKGRRGTVLSAGRAALDEIGLKVHPRSAMGSNPKVLEGLARDLGLVGEISRLAGATRHNINIGALLSSSRDARERVTMLRKIVAGLHELYGRPLPNLETLGRELRLPLRSSLLDGSQNDLRRVLWALQDRGGGGADVYDQALS